MWRPCCVCRVGSSPFRTQLPRQALHQQGGVQVRPADVGAQAAAGERELSSRVQCMGILNSVVDKLIIEKVFPDSEVCR